MILSKPLSGLLTVLSFEPSLASQNASQPPHPTHKVVLENTKVATLVFIGEGAQWKSSKLGTRHLPCENQVLLLNFLQIVATDKETKWKSPKYRWLFDCIHQSLGGYVSTSPEKYHWTLLWWLYKNPCVFSIDRISPPRRVFRRTVMVSIWTFPLQRCSEPESERCFFRWGTENDLKGWRLKPFHD